MINFTEKSIILFKVFRLDWDCLTLKIKKRIVKKPMTKLKLKIKKESSKNQRLSSSWDLELRKKSWKSQRQNSN